MPVNINQNHDSVANTRSYGCAVCCAADVASFYGNNTKIEVLDPYNSTGSGVYSDDPEGQDITLATSMRIQGASEIDMRQVKIH